MEYALAAYSHPEDQLHIFDKEAIERKDKEYEKWVRQALQCFIIKLMFYGRGND